MSLFTLSFEIFSDCIVCSDYFLKHNFSLMEANKRKFIRKTIKK